MPIVEMMRLMSEAAQHRKQAEKEQRTALAVASAIFAREEDGVPVTHANVARLVDVWGRTLASQNACLITGQEAILTALVQQVGHKAENVTERRGEGGTK